MGGGSLLTPALVLLVRVPIVTAVGTDLTVMTVTKGVGAWQHWRQGSIHVRTALLTATGSIPGAVGGVGLLVLLRHHGVEVDSLVGKILGVVLLGTAVIFLIQMTAGWRRPRHAPPERRIPRGCLPIVGFMLGALVSLTSVGSGSVFLPALVLLFGLPLARAVGTDIFHALLLTSVAGLAHLWVGDVDLPLLGAVLAGSIPGVFIGSRIMLRLPKEGVRAILTVALMAAALRLL